VDGCDISREQRCIQQLAPKMNNNDKKKKKQCVVSLMSDRLCTIETLTRWLHEEQGCQVLVVADHELQTSYLSEHGPFAGAGYFQDLALATAVARSAFVGLERSSSALVLELITFYRKMEAWQDDADIDQANLDICIMPDIEDPEGLDSG
jgi:hypothetical protein